jgi:hypothetical protein
LAVFEAASVRWFSGYELFLPDLFALNHGLERGSAATHFASMVAFSVVLVQPFIETILQRLDGFVELFAEGYLVELLQSGFVEALANAVGLRRLPPWFWGDRYR